MGGSNVPAGSWATTTRSLTTMTGPLSVGAERHPAAARSEGHDWRRADLQRQVRLVRLLVSIAPVPQVAVLASNEHPMLVCRRRGPGKAEDRTDYDHEPLGLGGDPPGGIERLSARVAAPYDDPRTIRPPRWSSDELS